MLFYHLQPPMMCIRPSATFNNLHSEQVYGNMYSCNYGYTSWECYISSDCKLPASIRNSKEGGTDRILRNQLTYSCRFLAVSLDEWEANCF